MKEMLTLDELRQITGFDKDKRKVCGYLVYDQDLLKYIPQPTFAHIHGHEVGGTNPGLLEALAPNGSSTFIYNVDFNHQVAQETALYWNKEGMGICLSLSILWMVSVI